MFETGEEILSQGRLERSVATLSVFSRTSPEHKGQSDVSGKVNQ